jgi:hypothetical protein
MGFEHHIFVDFENVREADLELLAGHSAAITLILGKHQKTLPLTMVEALRRLPPEQVILVQSAVSGKNALDFVLACLVGRAVERQPGISVHIVSKDKGFDALIAHLSERGIPTARHESLGAVSVLAGSPAAPAAPPALATSPATVAAARATKKSPKLKPVPPLVARVDCLAQRLGKITAARPQKRSTLAAYIKSQFGAGMTIKLTKETINGLIASGLLSVTPTDKVVYATPARAVAEAGDEDIDDECAVPF